MMEVAAKDIERLGGTTELIDIGKQKLPGGSEIPLPPIILGKLGSDPGKKNRLCLWPFGCAACSIRGWLGQRTIYLD